MRIEFRPIDIRDDDQIRALVKWENDEELYHLTTPTKKGHNRERHTFESLRTRYEKNPDNAEGIFMVFDDERPIGSFSLQMDPEHLMKKVEGTSWLGLTIGEREYWGKGVAQLAMDHFEGESKKLGAIRIELGTFEFNVRAQKFYKKLGYVEIGRFHDFTYWNGKGWDDIRMEKYL